MARVQIDYNRGGVLICRAEVEEAVFSINERGKACCYRGTFCEDVMTCVVHEDKIVKSLVL